ncbi:MAG: 23S rRNA (uridine(2552)-2'-O)-methyltransferase RlmE [Gammaproteobacteria bacterium]
MARSKSSVRWLREHFDDEYVRRARREGYRSRAVYKLIEVDAKDHLLKPGLVVVDLGAAPGGWAQYAAQRVGRSGMVIAFDILPMEDLAGVKVIQGDFHNPVVMEQLLMSMGGEQRADLVISDMAPNTSGIRDVDQPRAMALTELAVDFARRCLKPGGDLLIKVFQGEGFDALVRDLRKDFGAVAVRKPKASRARSPELYVLARNYRL